MDENDNFEQQQNQQYPPPHQEPPHYPPPPYQQPPYQQPPYQQPYAPQYQQHPYQQQMAQDPGKGLAIASLVLGIVSLLLPFAGIGTAIVGLILGIIAKKKQQDAEFPTGMAVAGMVCSLITLVLNLILTFACWIPLMCTASFLSNPANWY